MRATPSNGSCLSRFGRRRDPLRNDGNENCVGCTLWYPYPGGVTEHISHLDQCFREWGHDVKIIAACSQRPDTVQDNLISVSSSIISLPFNGSISRVSLSPRIYWPVKRLLERERFDVIHLHEPLMPALPLIVLRHSKAVNVGTFHAYREEHPGLQLMRPLLQPFMDKLDAKICVSRAAHETISQYFPDRYEIIPNGIDFRRFSDPSVPRIESFDDGRPNILFVGRLEQRKGFRYLLRAYERLIQQLPEARLIVVGAYSQEDCEPFAPAMHANTPSRRCGSGAACRRNSSFATTRRATSFAHLRRALRALASVLLEAMAAGKPIVATDIAGYRTVLENGREGWMVPPENEEALAEALLSMLHNPRLREEMGHNGQRKAAYDWHLVARRVLGVYEQLVEVRSETGRMLAKRLRSLTGSTSASSPCLSGVWGWPPNALTIIGYVLTFR